jgi:23S rRNA pseudouridine1911/1915/1917 synthase
VPANSNSKPALEIAARPQDAGKRLDHVLQAQLPEYSRSRIQSWIKDGRVLVDGAAERPSRLLRGTEIIRVEPAAPPPLRASAEDIPLTILYEDEDVIAVDKPAGMVVHAGAGVHSGTLVNALLHRYGALSGTGGPLRPGIVHRLDRFTSGVILIARNDAAHRNLAAQFAGRSVKKIYLALVHGKLREDSGLIEKPIARDPVRRTRMTAKLGRGRSAITRYRVLRRFERFTFLEVAIGTGRTHQIRVHMSAAGHAIAGDTLYGAPAKSPGLPPLGRYFLHAHSIRFAQPSTGREITVESPLPQALQAWMEQLGPTL